MQIFSGTPGIHHQSPLLQIHWQLCRVAPIRPPAVHSLLIAAPGRPIAAAQADTNRPAAPHQDAQMARKFAGYTGSMGPTPQIVAGRTRRPVIGRKTRSPPWAAQCSRRPHLSPGFGFTTKISCRHRCRRFGVPTQVLCFYFRPPLGWC